MCDSLLFINNGRIVHHGDADSLKQGVDTEGGFCYDVRILGDPNALADWIVLQPQVELLEARKHGARIRIAAEDPHRAADMLARMIKDGLRVVEFHKEQRNLEDAFIDILGRLDAGSPALPPAFPTAALAAASQPSIES
jgi:ABC-2 type transport system ATP-binding protein